MHSAPLRTEAEVVENRSEGAANQRLLLRVDHWPGFAPGQFVMLSPGTCGPAERTDPLLPRPMAIYRAQRSQRQRSASVEVGPGADFAPPSSEGAQGRRPREAKGSFEVEILFKVTGRGTALLSEARSGDRVRLVGPLGRAFSDPAPGENAVIVAGGTGIASVYELAARLAPRTDVSVLLGARTRDALMGREDFSKLGVRLQVATDDGSEGTPGLVTDLLDAAIDAIPKGRIYVCGPMAMMRRAAEIADARGRPCVVSLENTMACGFGVCLGCATPVREGGFALTCRDGPMFDAARIAWDKLA